MSDLYKGVSGMNVVTFSDVELLGLVIGVADAKRLYRGQLAPLFKRDSENDGAHIALAASHELVRRYLTEELRREFILTSPGLVAEYLRVQFVGLEHEIFVGLFLDSQHRLIAVEELARGTINEASVYPREVVKRTLYHNAAAIVAAHNHPSGIAEPSWADRTLTRRLKDALALIDVRVLDHFVIGGSNVISFAERGWL
jgi:DNA repair protein RadC